MTLPEPRSDNQPPQYIPPTPPFPLVRELAQQEAIAPGTPAPVSTGAAPVPQPAHPNVKDPYIAELLDILAQTKSVDAFLATVGLLAEMQGDEPSVIPTVIRNAERLGIYGRHALDKDGPGLELARQLTEQLTEMARGKTATQHPKATHRGKNHPPALGAGTYALLGLGLRMLQVISSSDFGPMPSMGIFTPVPVPPWVTERVEEKYSEKNDFRTPILPPVREGFPPPLCQDPPDDATVLRALRQKKPGVPFFSEELRGDVRIESERLVDKIDPPRFFPLVGPAQLHHCHWKCTVYYTETIDSSYPFSYRTSRPRVEVVYIAKNHLHLYPDVPPDFSRDPIRD
jgi:hypothetical protein